jgi:hypothetical protein
MSDTAPYVEPTIVAHADRVIDTNNFDMEKIISFNEKVSICSTCEKCIEQNGIATCSEKMLPLAVVANDNSCIIGKW